MTEPLSFTDTGDDAASLHTAIDFIRWGASRMNAAGVFFGHGTDNAIDEAAALVLHALHLPPDLPEPYLRAALTGAEKRAAATLLERRINDRTPTAYLTREAWFMGLSFYVDERVLIPRSPLAELIEQQFQPWLQPPQHVASILDLCCGSGCIGIASAYAFEDAEVDLSDLSDDALAVAQRNVDEHGLAERVNVVRSDLFAMLGGRRYDLIISNPPYVANAELAALPAEYHREPSLALAAGDDGLDYTRRLLRQARHFLNADGLLAVEVGSAEAALLAAYPEVAFVWPEFNRGGGGVFLLSAADLNEYAAQF